jgi:hypothetical protein
LDIILTSFHSSTPRHLYALYCLLQRELGGNLNPSPDDPAPPASNGMPAIFTDPGYGLLSTSILSTSNCGNPALRLFGFGPTAADGYGLGYIIKEDGISMYVFTETRRAGTELLYEDVHPRSIYRHEDIWTLCRDTYLISSGF